MCIVLKTFNLVCAEIFSITQAAIKITGSPRSNLNATYYRKPGCRRPREFILDRGGLAPGVVAGYESSEGCCLYKLDPGNWAIHTCEEAWIQREITYLTWDERTNYYGHKDGSVFKW